MDQVPCHLLGGQISAPRSPASVLGARPLPPQFGDFEAVAGLSAISFDRREGAFYAISDDHAQPAHFYKLNIKLSDDGIDQIEVLSARALLDKRGKPYPVYDPAVGNSDAPDPEGIAVDTKRGQLLWSSEGVRTASVDVHSPALRAANLDGSYVADFVLPTTFTMSADCRFGPRNNLSLEGIGITPDGEFVVAAMEAPLYQDGPLPTVTLGALARVTYFGIATRRAAFQYAYPIDTYPGSGPLQDWQVNGIADVIALSRTTMLVLERAIDTTPSCRVFLADNRFASDVLAVPCLSTVEVLPMQKQLVVDVSAMPGVPEANYEGMTLGPVLKSGRQTVIFVSDNDFDPDVPTWLLVLTI